MHHVTLQLNAEAAVRRELYQGRMHTIVPAVIVVAGVLNGALVAAEEIAKFPEAWNGRPVPILHPMQNGQPISANLPDVLERKAGYVFNTRFDTDRLRAEFWLDEDQMVQMGQADLLATLQAGGTPKVEVSTGYFCDSVDRAGEFKGKTYSNVHLNLRPDHVALLPNQTGACSILDGCGVPRIHQQATDVEKTGLAKALNAIGAALGLKTNCSCEEAMKPTEITALVQKLAANGADLAPVKALANLQTNFDIAELEKLSDAGRAALGAVLKSLDKTAAKAAEAAPGEDDDKVPANNSAKPVTAGELAAMIANGVKAGLAAALPKLQADLLVNSRRVEVVARLMANQRNVLSESTLNAMNIDELVKLDESLRVVDYSGMGSAAFRANAGDSTPLVAPACMLAPIEKAH